MTRTGDEVAVIPETMQKAGRLRLTDYIGISGWQSEQDWISGSPSRTVF